MKVRIYGLGVVGGALYRYLNARGHEVSRIDPGLGLNETWVDKPDCIFICVPVPTKHFKLDFSIVEGILKEHQHSTTPIFLKSTVLPGTADNLSQIYNVNIISCPEFLTERNADRDTASLPVIYGKQGHRIMSELFPEHARIPMLNAECEMAKYAHNCFGATKVTFFNGIYEQCSARGLSYDRVLQGILASGHINRQHTQVPGPDGKKGYGGHCFPKDMEAFIGFLKHTILGKWLLDAHCMNRFYRGLKSPDKLPQGEVELPKAQAFMDIGQ
jgi:UDPglucose 6-dehydrogenase